MCLYDYIFHFMCNQWFINTNLVPIRANGDWQAGKIYKMDMMAYWVFAEEGNNVDCNIRLPAGLTSILLLVCWILICARKRILKTMHLWYIYIKIYLHILTHTYIYSHSFVWLILYSYLNTVEWNILLLCTWIYVLCYVCK